MSKEFFQHFGMQQLLQFASVFRPPKNTNVIEFLSTYCIQNQKLFLHCLDDGKIYQFMHNAIFQNLKKCPKSLYIQFDADPIKNLFLPHGRRDKDRLLLWPWSLPASVRAGHSVKFSPVLLSPHLLLSFQGDLNTKLNTELNTELGFA